MLFNPAVPSNAQISINNTANNRSSGDGFQQDKGSSLPPLKMPSQIGSREVGVQWAHMCKCQPAQHIAAGGQAAGGAGKGEAISTIVFPIFQSRWQLLSHRHVQIRVQNPLHNTKTSVFTKVTIIV